MKCIYIIANCLVLLITSCLPKPLECDEWASGFRDDTQANIILKKIDINGPLVSLYGKDPMTGFESESYDGSGWLKHIYHKFRIGDTIIKKKGQYTILIKRRGNVILIPMVCEGKTYKD